MVELNRLSHSPPLRPVLGLYQRVKVIAHDAAGEYLHPQQILISAHHLQSSFRRNFRS